MSKKLGIVAIVLCIIALGLSVGAITMVSKQASDQKSKQQSQQTSEQESQKDIQYVLFLGTNDKDTNEPVYAPDEAKEKVKEILIRDFGGYTIQEANGGWIGDDGKEYQEYTLVIYLSDTTQDQVHAACDELIEVFDQSSILIQENKTQTEFYSGE